VAAPNVTVVVPDFEVLVEWLAVAQGGVRGRGVITATAPSVLPASQIDVVIPCVDDTGGAHELRARAGTLGVTVTPPSSANAVSTTAEISIEPALPVSVAWIELQPPGSASPVRVDLHSPATLLSGRSEPPWPTPAEWFLDDLLPDLIDADPGASFGVGLDAAGVRQVGAAVADALLAVGALPPASPLLAGYPQRYGRWHHELTRRYTARANRDLAAGRPRHVAAVGAAVALEHAVAVFDAVVILGRDVWLHLYVSPDAVGEYWPGIFRPFRIDATDDLGHQHQTVPATRWWYDHQGIGDLWLWPPLEPAARALRLTVSTPWEAAWIEIPLPTD
jgi:hypothetical protein